MLWVFKTSRFEVSKEVVQSYFQASDVSNEEVLGSPVKRKVSVQGHVIEVTFC